MLSNLNVKMLRGKLHQESSRPRNHFPLLRCIMFPFLAGINPSRSGDRYIRCFAAREGEGLAVKFPGVDVFLARVEWDQGLTMAIGQSILDP